MLPEEINLILSQRKEINRKIALTSRQVMEALARYTKEPIDLTSSLEFRPDPQSNPRVYTFGTWEVFFHDPKEEERLRKIEEDDRLGLL